MSTAQSSSNWSSAFPTTQDFASTSTEHLGPAVAARQPPSTALAQGPPQPARGLSLLDEWAPVLDSLAQQAQAQQQSSAPDPSLSAPDLGFGQAQLTSPSSWSAYPNSWDFLAQQRNLGQGLDGLGYAPSLAHTPSYAGSVSEFNASDSDFFADVEDPIAPFPFGGPAATTAPSSLHGPTFSDSYTFEPDPTDIPFQSITASPPQLAPGPSLPSERAGREDTLTHASDIQALMGQPVDVGRPWSRHGTRDGSQSTMEGSRAYDAAHSNFSVRRRQESFSRTTLANMTPSPQPEERPAPTSVMPVRQGSRGASADLYRLDIPVETPSVSIMESTPIGGERTAGPETARPTQPKSRGTNEVEKLLRELNEQAERQAAGSNDASVAWNGFLPNLQPVRVPSRQRSRSDVSGASPTVASFAYGLPPDFQQQLQQSFASEHAFDATRTSLSAPSYSPAPIRSDSSDSEGIESQAGPRRRSDAHAAGRPQWSPYDPGASMLPPGSRLSLRRSHSVGHRHDRDSSLDAFPVAGPSFSNMPSYPEMGLPVVPMDYPEAYGLPYPLPAASYGMPIPPPLRSASAQSYGSGHSSSHSRSSSYAGADGTDIVHNPAHWDSQTTEATKSAAAARRKPGTEAKFVCDYCGETFTRQYNLKGHLRAHNGERPFVCDFPGCDKSFARSHDLKRHSGLHSSLMKYPCGGCGKAFKRLDALQRHHRSEAGKICAAKIAAGKGVQTSEYDDASGAVWL